MPRAKASNRSVVVLSDSTGNLARHILTAVLTQFPSGSTTVRFETFVRTEARLGDLLRQARQEKAAVCHAMVSDKLKRRIKAYCRAGRMPCHDLTGGIVRFLHRAIGTPASGDLEALHQLDDAYRQRIGAMEYTLNHDDGLGLDSLHEADIVLVGISRTSKTPTSILLAQQGYRTANVSLARCVEPPTELFSLPPRKAIGLIINPSQLTAIRARRQTAWNMSRTDYGDGERVADEVDWSRALFRKQGWPVVDVTDQAVEETAAKIIQLVGPASERDPSRCVELPK